MNEDNEKIIQLLTEIRDAQREAKAERDKLVAELKRRFLRIALLSMLALAAALVMFGASIALNYLPE